MRLRSLHRAYPSLHPSGVVHWVPEQLNIKAVTGACKLIDGCSLALCSTTVSVVSAGICHRNKVNSIAWLHRKAQPKDSIIYITLHTYIHTYITALQCPFTVQVRRMPGVGYQSTICRRRIRPYWHHSPIRLLLAWLLRNTTSQLHPGSTPSVVPRNGSRVASSEPTIVPGWFRIEPSGLISFDRLTSSTSKYRKNTGRCLLRTALEMPESSGTLCHL